MCKDHRFYRHLWIRYVVQDKIIYALSWRTVSALTWVLCFCLFPSLLHNSGNKHKHNPLVSAETAHHSSTYIILYLSYLDTKSSHRLNHQMHPLPQYPITMIIGCCLLLTRQVEQAETSADLYQLWDPENNIHLKVPLKYLHISLWEMLFVCDVVRHLDLETWPWEGWINSLVSPSLVTSYLTS